MSRFDEMSVDELVADQKQRGRVVTFQEGDEYWQITNADGSYGLAEDIDRDEAKMYQTRDAYLAVVLVRLIEAYECATPVEHQGFPTETESQEPPAAGESPGTE